MDILDNIYKSTHSILIEVKKWYFQDQQDKRHQERELSQEKQQVGILLMALQKLMF
jgi:hypothetical protein